jgi:hypothetical protein
VCTGFNLRKRITRYPIKIAGGHLGGKHLAAGRVDAFADDRERAVRANGYGLCSGFEYRFFHLERFLL